MWFLGAVWPGGRVEQRSCMKKLDTEACWINAPKGYTNRSGWHHLQKETLIQQEKLLSMNIRWDSAFCHHNTTRTQRLFGICHDHPILKPLCRPSSANCDWLYDSKSKEGSVYVIVNGEAGLKDISREEAAISWWEAPDCGDWTDWRDYEKPAIATFIQRSALYWDQSWPQHSNRACFLRG